MNLKQFAALTVLSAALTATTVLPVEAARAVVTNSARVYAGPGSDFRVVGRLRGGDRVNVTRCARSRRWCQVQSRHTRDGWVRSVNLDRVRGGRGPNPRGGICFFGSRGQVCLGA